MLPAADLPGSCGSVKSSRPWHQILPSAKFPRQLHLHPEATCVHVSPLVALKQRHLSVQLNESLDASLPPAYVLFQHHASLPTLPTSWRPAGQVARIALRQGRKDAGNCRRHIPFGARRGYSPSGAPVQRAPPWVAAGDGTHTPDVQNSQHRGACADIQGAV